MNIDSIIAEWTYRLEKGYPDCPEDYIELRNVLHEQTDLPIEEQDAIVRRAMGLEEAVISGNEFADLVQELGKTKSKINQIRLLADYTKDYSTLGIRQTNFEDENFGNYSEDPSKYQLNNITDAQGEPIEFDINAKFDDIIEQLALNLIGEHMQGNQKPQWLAGQDKGHDGKLGSNIQFEVKGTSKGPPNTMFQTSFPIADTDSLQRYYIFVNHNNDRQNLVFNNVSVVSSDLLRKALYGRKIYDEFKESGVSETLRNEIQQGLAGFKFEEHIVSALTTGETTGYQKQFKLGNNVVIAFKIFIQTNKFSASDNDNDSLTEHNEGYEI
tara:strand:+ start:168 stop:1148 length:981 start_codon:yes stop_codon:yes gene_type:complete